MIIKDCQYGCERKIGWNNTQQLWFDIETAEVHTSAKCREIRKSLCKDVVFTDRVKRRGGIKRND